MAHFEICKIYTFRYTFATKIIGIIIISYHNSCCVTVLRGSTWYDHKQHLYKSQLSAYLLHTSHHACCQSSRFLFRLFFSLLSRISYKSSLFYLDVKKGRIEAVQLEKQKFILKGSGSSVVDINAMYSTETTTLLDICFVLLGTGHQRNTISLWLSMGPAWILFSKTF